MTFRVPRLPFSLDPLMAEAKRRARQRRMLTALALLLAGLGAGLAFAFGSPGGRSPSGGGLTSGNLSNYARRAGLSSGPFAVTTGMTPRAVLAVAGRPLRVVRSNPRNPDCWDYGKYEGKYVAVCFKHGRVDIVGP